MRNSAWYCPWGSRLALAWAATSTVGCYTTALTQPATATEDAPKVELQWDTDNLSVTKIDGDEVSEGALSFLAPAHRAYLTPGTHQVRATVRGLEETVGVELVAGQCYTVDSGSGKYWKLPGRPGGKGEGGFVVVEGCNMMMNKSDGKVVAASARGAQYLGLDTAR
jgi:hypothetical protein